MTTHIYMVNYVKMYGPGSALSVYLMINVLYVISIMVTISFGLYLCSVVGKYVYIYQETWLRLKLRPTSGGAGRCSSGNIGSCRLKLLFSRYD